MRCETVAVVGNGPVKPEDAAAIDASDCVIRFNRPPHSQEEAGKKTDILFFMNSGKSAQKLLSDPAYLREAAVANCRRVILPYHPSIIARYHPKPNFLSCLKGRRADWTRKAIEVFGEADKEVLILSPRFYEECCAELGIAREKRTSTFPSTGFIGIYFAAKELFPPALAIRPFGFSWQGWKRHPWDTERTWVQANLRGEESS